MASANCSSESARRSVLQRLPARMSIEASCENSRGMNIEDEHENIDLSAANHLERLMPVCG